MEIRPHINPKTGRPFTTAEYCQVIVSLYDKAYTDYQNNNNPKKGEFISPIGGIHDKRILDYAKYVLSIENPYEREQVAIDHLTNKNIFKNISQGV